MLPDPSNPHDTYFRNMLGYPEDAASEMRAVLPKKLVAHVDWSTVERLWITLVSDELRDRQGDLLFRACVDGREAYIYVLLDHQSGSDSLMAFRMLEYVVGVWTQHLREHEDAKTLPPVIPVVVHVGPKGGRWTAPREVAELIDIEPGLRDSVSVYLPRMQYLLDDVNALDPDALLARPLTPGARVLLVLEKMLPEDLYSLFEPLGPEAMEVVMTTAEMLEAR